MALFPKIYVDELEIITPLVYRHCPDFHVILFFYPVFVWNHRIYFSHDRRYSQFFPYRTKSAKICVWKEAEKNCFRLPAMMILFYRDDFRLLNIELCYL